MRNRKQNEKGVSLIIVTLCCIFVVIPMVGLAIDASVMYWTKAKLSAAVDAAALAGARALNITGTFTDRQMAGTAAADQWFRANFPPGFLGTAIVGGVPSVAVSQTNNAVMTVDVAATAIVPTYFMRILGFQTVNINATAESARRNVNVMLILDRSGSMGPPPLGSNACPTMISSAQLFTGYFTDGFDTLGLVTFSTTGSVDYLPTKYFKSGTPTINSVIGQIGCAGATNATEGLELAWQQIQALNQTGALNVIVFFTDGQPNVVVSNQWPVKTKADVRWGYNTPGAPSDYNTPVATPKSGCTAATLSGAMSILLAGSQAPAVNGYTGGLFVDAPAPINSAGLTLQTSPGCSYNNSQYGLTVRQDVAYIPGTDAWGNLTTDNGYKPVDVFPASNLSYIGQIRPDEQTVGLMASAFNTADYLGRQVRSNPTYPVIIYTIGLDGAPDVPVDQQFLMRMANDPNAGSGAYNPSLLAGQFKLSPTPAQLSQAFQQIASEILRLSK